EASTGLLGRGRRRALHLHRVPTCSDEQVTRFLTQQRNGLCVRDRWPRLFRTPILIHRRIEFFRRKFRRWNFVAGIALPQNRAQTSAIGSAKISDQCIDLLLGDFSGYVIYSTLTIQG